MRQWALCVFPLVVMMILWIQLTEATAGRNTTVTRWKAGHCPRRLKVVPSSKGCVCDDDCAGDDKCCIFDCGAVCVPPAFTKPGICPRSRTIGVGMCAEFCSDDSDCPKNEKCCHNGCGHTCTAPFTVKPGRCGIPKGTPMCAEYCYHDGQCPAEQKCCRTTCGHSCTEPC